ncbi:uncharacterized protein LOC26535817 [Drosophila yakuba]|uniref:Uncharacterized protein n=1 Tax=Drosophila yakuba TaxID=7245 RepID=A0A0R1DJX1_DROYA|nr:uncharacterized protein LOC26535817 [Drosophila yakuba]XP_039479484.1 uncharacterized protein LOC120444044 [Drosophila santomea]KRJ97572.1 uncharacterized protein Dyak_GE28636 [Drosophila yakuba]
MVGGLSEARERCKFCGPGLGAAQFKPHNSDRSVGEISSGQGAAPRAYRAWESKI